jgi:beta-phosphoglucomutase
MVTTIIFDMDGVIVDSEPTHQKLEIEMFSELGLHISDEERIEFVGTSSVDMWKKIGKRHDLAKSPDELLLYGRQKYWDALEAGKVPLVQGAVQLITDLRRRGLIIQVASSATRPTVDHVLALFRLESFFKYRIGGDEVAHSKPNPDIFLEAARQSGSDPAKCVVIEDSANGVKAAKQAGMFCIGYANPGTGKQDLSLADIVVNSLEKISVDTFALLNEPQP